MMITSSWSLRLSTYSGLIFSQPLPRGAQQTRTHLLGNIRVSWSWVSFQTFSLVGSVGGGRLLDQQPLFPPINGFIQGCNYIFPMYVCVCVRKLLPVKKGPLTRESNLLGAPLLPVHQMQVAFHWLEYPAKERGGGGGKLMPVR